MRLLMSGLMLAILFVVVKNTDAAMSGTSKKMERQKNWKEKVGVPNVMQFRKTTKEGINQFGKEKKKARNQVKVNSKKDETNRLYEAYRISVEQEIKTNPQKKNVGKNNYSKKSVTREKNLEKNKRKIETVKESEPKMEKTRQKENNTLENEKLPTDFNKKDLKSKNFKNFISKDNIKLKDTSKANNFDEVIQKENRMKKLNRNLPVSKDQENHKSKSYVSGNNLEENVKAEEMHLNKQRIKCDDRVGSQEKDVHECTAHDENKLVNKDITHGDNTEHTNEIKRKETHSKHGSVTLTKASPEDHNSDISKECKPKVLKKFHLVKSPEELENDENTAPLSTSTAFKSETTKTGGTKTNKKIYMYVVEEESNGRDIRYTVEKDNGEVSCGLPEVLPEDNL